MFGNIFDRDNLWVIIIAVIVIVLLAGDKNDGCGCRERCDPGC